MSYFQNLFEATYQGHWLYGDDLSASFTFQVPPNKNTSETTLSGNSENYDFSSLNTLTFNFAIDKDFKNYVSFTVNVAGATASATTAQEVVTLLNADSTFSEWFVASVYKNKNLNYVMIKSLGNRLTIRWYISNSGAERIIRFNKNAGIADIPKFFQRHTIDNRFAYEHSTGSLIRLTHDITSNTVANPTVVTATAHGLTNGETIYIVNSNCSPTIDGARVITYISADTFSVPVNVTTAGTRGEFLTTTEYNIVREAGFTYSAMKDDHEHLAGRTGAFVCKKNTVDASSRILNQILYNSGAVAGDLAKKVFYTYTGAQTQPDTQIELPYILKSTDILSP